MRAHSVVPPGAEPRRQPERDEGGCRGAGRTQEMRGDSGGMGPTATRPEGGAMGTA